MRRNDDPAFGERNLHDVILVLVLALLAVAIDREVDRAPPSWFPGDIGVAAVPGLINWALVALIVALAGKTIWRWRSTVQAEICWSEIRDRLRAQATRFVLTFLLLCTYVALLGNELIGFPVLSVAYVGLNLFVLLGPGKRNAALSVGVSMVIVFVVTVTFTRIFSLVLP